MRTEYATAIIEQTVAAVQHLTANTDCRIDPHAAGAACLVTGPTHQVASICEESMAAHTIDAVYIPADWRDAVSFCVEVCGIPETDAVVTVERAIAEGCPSVEDFIDAF